MAEEEGFLSRWSRRKLSERSGPGEGAPSAAPPPGTAAGELARENAAGPDTVDAGDDPGAAPHPAEEIDIETLGADSDFTVFMQKGVSADLRRRALRRLWASNPLFNEIDELQDCYDIERRYGMGPMGGTDWQIGRGFLTDEDLGLTPSGEAGDETTAGGPDETGGDGEPPDPAAAAAPDGGEDPDHDAGPRGKPDRSPAGGGAPVA